MRVRTEKKRQEIVAAAKEIFAEQGPEGASMEAIALRAGASKATLYGYFPSKDDLFIAALREASAEEMANVSEFIETAPNFRAGLERFALWRLRTTLTPAGLAVRKMIWSQAGPGVVQKFFGDVDERTSTWGRLAAQFELAMKRGDLRRADPWTAAQHFRGILETDLSDRFFFGFPNGGVDEAMMRKTAKTGTEVFLRAYARESDP